jgi:chondroitin-sulfate-ABC endolyase/exolyase
MRNSSKLKSVQTSLLFLLSMTIWSQQEYQPVVESFEHSIALKNFSSSRGSMLTPSKDHHKYGVQSLEWKWTEPGYFSTQSFSILKQEESPLKYGNHFPSSPMLAMAIYNEQAQNENIKISSSKDGENEMYFEINLNFTGWRTIWVPYYEMQGAAPKKTEPIDINTFTVSTNATKGKLFFDDIVYSQYQDDRHPYPDQIVPFIKSDKDLAADHWIPLSKNIEAIYNISVKEINDTQKNDLVKIETRLDKGLHTDKKHKVYLNSITEQFDKLNLTDNGKTVLGPPMDFYPEQIHFDENQQGKKEQNHIRDLGKMIKKLADNYSSATSEEKKAIEEMFVVATKYYLDQGWQSGSAGGTRHHIGYQVRELTQGFYIMRETLKKEGILEEVGASLHYLYNLGKILKDESNFHVNIDYLNTQAYYHLLLVFLVEDQNKKALLLDKYSNYIGITLSQQNEIGGFKIDGTSWHHNGHYPAYGMGAFQNVPKIIHSLSGTAFRINEKGHANFKNAFLTTRSYSQKLDYGFGNAGRHPFEGNNIASLKQPYLQMAYSGNPSGTEIIDKEVAAAYLRLWGKNDTENTNIFRNTHHVKEEVLPHYKTLPYAATAIHRNNDWAALIKGYSKYVWASEIYVASNRYGRYPANGTIQLLKDTGEAESGFQQNGWDWNRYPGATVIHLPIEELEPNTPLLMYRSNETFAGATELNGNGVFAMILDESKGTNADGEEKNLGFPGKLKARKSVFSFGNKLICIGSDISSIDGKNKTQTNLFQSSLKSTKIAIKTDKKCAITGHSKKGKIKKWVIDPYGNGYYLLSNSNAFFSRETQHSYHNKYSVKTGGMNPKGKGAKETKGDFAAAWIDHGTTPKNAGYQYVIYPFLSKSEQKTFGKTAKKDTSYEILKADTMAHVVIDKETSTTAYAIFEANKNVETGVVQQVSAPALVMCAERNKQLQLSIVQPDLNFEQIRFNKYINFSRPVTLDITLHGNYSAKNEKLLKKIQHVNGTTVISIECIDGLPVKLNLSKN